MITPEELKNLAKKEFDIADMMPEYMELFEKEARQAIEKGETKLKLPFSSKISEKFRSSEDMYDAIAKELMQRGFILRKATYMYHGFINGPSWHVFFTDDND